jgi:hypothetical protein
MILRKLERVSKKQQMWPVLRLYNTYLKNGGKPRKE